MKLSKIKPNSQNPRLIKDERFRKLVKSIQEFPKMMELRPIIINDDGIILGGNMRFKALKELDYSEIPDSWVKKASELSEDEQRRFIAVDNVGFGEWDIEELQASWSQEELQDWGGVEAPLIFENIKKRINNDSDFENAINEFSNSNCQLPIVPDFF